MKTKIILIAIILFAIVGQLYSQTDAHKKAAEELLIASGAEQNYKLSMEKMMEIQLKSNPSIAQYSDIIKQWAEKYISWSSLKADMVKLYTDEFSEKELKELSKFYKSPIGIKFASKHTEINIKMAEIGQKKALEHTPELQKMIMDKMGDKKD